MSKKGEKGCKKKLQSLYESRKNLIKIMSLAFFHQTASPSWIFMCKKSIFFDKNAQIYRYERKFSLTSPPEIKMIERYNVIVWFWLEISQGIWILYLKMEKMHVIVRKRSKPEKKLLEPGFFDKKFEHPEVCNRKISCRKWFSIVKLSVF